MSELPPQVRLPVLSSAASNPPEREAVPLSSEYEETVESRRIPDVLPVSVHPVPRADRSAFKYITDESISGYQNRRKLLRASLSGLDWEKDYVKPPQARIVNYKHEYTERLLDRVKKERREVFSYLSDDPQPDKLTDKFYMMACQPGLRQSDSLSALHNVAIDDFRASIINTLVANGDLDLGHEEPAQSPEKEKGADGKSIKEHFTDDITVNFPNNAAPVIDQPRLKSASQTTSAGSEEGISSAEEVLYSPGMPYSRILTAATASRATSAQFPFEPDWPVEVPDLRQVNVPPPFYRTTFGVLGDRKEIKENPKLKTKAATVQLSLKPSIKSRSDR